MRGAKNGRLDAIDDIRQNAEAVRGVLEPASEAGLNCLWRKLPPAHPNHSPIVEQTFVGASRRPPEGSSCPASKARIREGEETPSRQDGGGTSQASKELVSKVPRHYGPDPRGSSRHAPGR